MSLYSHVYQGAVERIITVANPAAGADWSQSVPAGKKWEVKSARAQLVTSAAVANRIPRLVLDDGTNIYFHSQAPTAQTASLTNTYCWAENAGGNQNSNAGFGPFEALPELLMLAGHRIRPSTIGIDVADQWSLIVLYVVEFTL